MGLIDEIRKKRDSWTARLEEHRRDPEEKDADNSDGADDVDELILKNRSNVGNFPKREEF
jgi:hypothetical protein